MGVIWGYLSMDYELFGLVMERVASLNPGKVRPAFLAFLLVKPRQQIDSQHPWGWLILPGAW